MSFPSGDPYANLETSIKRLLYTKTFPSSTYFAGTVILVGRSGDKKATGSGFVIQVGGLPSSSDPDFFLVTVSHTVLEAQAYGVELEALIIRGFDPQKAIQERVNIPIDSSSWSHNPSSDVAMCPFPVDHLPDDHNLVAIPVTELATRKTPVLLSDGAQFAAYGRWASIDGANIPIRRELTLATFERPAAWLTIGGAKRRVELFLAEGNVSKGMSGGPVTYAGGGWGDSRIIGLVHGYLPLALDDLPDDQPPSAAEPQRLNEAFVRIRSQIESMNSRIVYVVPISDLEPLLTKVGFGK